MKKKYLKFSNKLIAFVLALLGVGTACSSASEYGTPAEEYGVPHADFKVKGIVKSAFDDEVIEGIRVSLNYDTAYTGQDGNYLVVHTSVPSTTVLHINFQDTDGNENEAYLSFDTTIVFENPVFTGGDGNWYEGYTEKTLNVKLNPAK